MEEGRGDRLVRVIATKADERSAMNFWGDKIKGINYSLKELGPEADRVVEHSLTMVGLHHGKPSLRPGKTPAYSVDEIKAIDTAAAGIVSVATGLKTDNCVPVPITKGLEELGNVTQGLGDEYSAERVFYMLRVASYGGEERVDMRVFGVWEKILTLGYDIKRSVKPERLVPVLKSAIGRYKA